MAAGCTLKKDKLNEFKNFLNYQYLKKFKRINNIKNYISIQNFDSLKSFSKDELQYLEPFGNNNINPFFLVEKIKIIIKLMNLNERRKQIQIKTINLLKSKNDIINQDIIFKYETNINEGLLGIVASNFVELYNRPSFVLTNSGNIIKCSSRSIIGFDVGKIFYSALKKK